MKKISLLIFIVSLSLILNSCQFIWPSASNPSPTPTEGSVDKNTPYLSEFQNSWCYQRLDQSLKTAYAAVYQQVKEKIYRDETIVISDSKSGKATDYNGLRIKLPLAFRNREDASKLYTAFTRDNPQFFFIGNIYSYEGYRTGNTDAYNVLCLTFTMNAKERKEATAKLNNVVASFIEGLDSESSFDKELILHDKLINHCVYDEKTAQSKNPLDAAPSMFTAYGALVEKKAVCEGYSRAMQLLLHAVDIECTLVSGTNSDGISHMWNMVTINDRNYHLDPTWNDLNERIRHTYFNLTSDEISNTHQIDNENIGIDTCSSIQANYYRYTGRYITDLDRNVIAIAAAREIRDGKDVIDLRFAPHAFANAQLFVSESKLMKSYVNEQLKDTNLQMWKYEYSWDEQYCTISIYKKQKNS